MSDKAQIAEIHSNIEAVIARINKARRREEESHRACLRRIARLAASYQLDTVEPALLENAFQEIAREYLNRIN